MDVKVFPKSKSYYDNFNSIFKKDQSDAEPDTPCTFCGSTSETLIYNMKGVCSLCANAVARLCVKNKFEKEDTDGN